MGQETQAGARERIHRAYLELLGEMPLHKIKVIDICRRAGVSRTTYYYGRERFEPGVILDEILDDLMAGIEERAGLSSLDDEDTYALNLRLASYLREKADLLRPIYRCEADALFQWRYRDFFWSFYRDVPGEGFAEGPYGRMLFDYLIAGNYASYRSWVLGGCRMPVEDFARFFVDVGRQVTPLVVEQR